MKYLTIIMCLFSSLCFGSGKLSIEPMYFPKIEKVAPKVGFSIYEHLILGVNFSTWVGFGWQPRVAEDSVLWATARADLEKWFGGVGVSAGYTYRHAEQPGLGGFEESGASDVHLRLQIQLW